VAQFCPKCVTVLQHKLVVAALLQHTALVHDTCYKGVIMVLQGSNTRVTVVLRSVTVVLHWCYSGVTMVSQ
jgi:hypothetical protein